MKRTVATKKMEDGDSGIIGKKKMDFKVFEKICALFLKEDGKEFLFARCFLVLEWNLMSRSDNIVHAHLFHITWEDNCLAFRFAKKQNRPDGEEQQSGVACLCHTRQTCNLSCSCPCNLCHRHRHRHRHCSGSPVASVPDDLHVLYHHLPAKTNSQTHHHLN